jgi:pyridoxamine 5'-phosphate oxidase
LATEVPETANERHDIPSWRTALAASLHRNRSSAASRYFQLATVSDKGLPSVRTVVFRGFEEATSSLIVVTDRRSEKVRHLATNSAGSVCWYFEGTREQYRLDCRSTPHFFEEGSPLFHGIATGLSEATRRTFLWPTPGAERNPDSDFFDQALLSPEALRNLCVLLLAPYSIDYLDLRHDPHQRVIYTQQQSHWIQTAINP